MSLSLDKDTASCDGDLNMGAEMVAGFEDFRKFHCTPAFSDVRLNRLQIWTG